MIGRYFSACNEIDNNNMMQQSEPAIEKYWVTQSKYFIFATTVTLGMGITYGKLLFFRFISGGNRDNQTTMRE